MQDQTRPHPFVLMQKIEDFADWFFPVVDRFPNREKWALCTQIKNCVFRLARIAIRIQKSRQKLKELFDLDIELEILRFLVRRAHKRRYLSNPTHFDVTERVSEIGKILGGIVRRCKGA